MCVFSGVRVKEHYGNFFIRSNDLLALPNVDRDKAIGVHLEVNEPKELAALMSRGPAFISLQAALLYTTSNGQRRIRTMTKCLPVSKDLGDLYRTVHLDTCINFFSKVATEKALTSSFNEARNAVINKCIDILAKYHMNFVTTSTPQLICPDSLKLLPLKTLALIKHPALRYVPNACCNRSHEPL